MGVVVGSHGYKASWFVTMTCHRSGCSGCPLMPDSSLADGASGGGDARRLRVGGRGCEGGCGR
eukprot:28810-Eustigmatos_ZCMA.PRE.1